MADGPKWSSYWPHDRWNWMSYYCHCVFDDESNKPKPTTITSSKCRHNYDRSTRNSNRSGAKPYPAVLIAACVCAWMSGVEPKEQLEWDRVGFSSANSKKPCNAIGCPLFLSSNQLGLKWVHVPPVHLFWHLLPIITLYHQKKKYIYQLIFCVRRHDTICINYCICLCMDEWSGTNWIEIGLGFHLEIARNHVMSLGAH